MVAESQPETGSGPRRARKSQQLVLRVDPRQKALLERAAEASGRTITDILTEGGRAVALRILEEERAFETWSMEREDASIFVEHLLAPRSPDDQTRIDYAAYVASREERFVQAANDAGIER